MVPPAVLRKFPATPVPDRRQVVDHSESEASGMLRARDQPPVGIDAMAWLLARFRPISLAKLNAGSAMLERLDNKYVVHLSVLQHIAEFLSAHFDILEIEGKRAFTYETCYFDDAQHTSYFEHHQGRRQRCKIRVRKYADAQSCFVEVKLKDKRDHTIKKRLEYPTDKYRTLDERAMAHIQRSYSDIYGREFVAALKPVLDVSYRRITLVAKKGGERITIDSGLVFSGDDRSCVIDASLFIVEIKSANGNGIADKVLRRLHQHPTGGCSKYCLGTALLQLVNKYNKFLPALRKVGTIRGTQWVVKDLFGLLDDTRELRGSPALR